MEEETKKINLIKALIWIPVIITIVCGTIDTALIINNKNVSLELIATIFRTIISYWSPSFISIVISNMWQQFYDDNFIAFNEDELKNCKICTVIYCIFYLLFFILYNIFTGGILLILTIAYTWYVYDKCFIETIKTSKPKDKKEVHELLEAYIENKEEKGE